MGLKLNRHLQLAMKMKIKYNRDKSSRVDYAATVIHSIACLQIPVIVASGP